MSRETIYRNIALIGSLLLLANVLYFNSQKQFELFSSIIEIGIVPITIIIVGFWYKNNIVLIGIALYFISYATEVYPLIFGSDYNSIIYEYRLLLGTIGPIGIVIVILAGSKLMKKNVVGWLFKQIKKPELIVLSLALITILTTGGIIYTLG